MHRAFLRVAALLGLLAVMAAAGGCVALYTLSRATDGPDDAGGGVGLPLFPPGTSTVSPVTVTATVTAPADGGDGLPFNPYVTDTPPVPFPSGMDTPVEAILSSSNATPVWNPMPADTPWVGGSPPYDEIGRPTLPATPP